MSLLRASADDVAGIGIFAGLDVAALHECADPATRRTLPNGRSIFNQGDPCVRFQALLAGCIRISQTGPEGGLALLRFVGAGEPYGSFGLFVDGTYPGEAVTVTPAIELSWSRAHFRELIERYPAIAINLVELAARRLAELQERLRELTTLPAEQRIARALLRLVHTHGCPRADGRIEVPWPLRRKDVATMSATALYTVSRVMTRWERAGVLASDQKRVSIGSPAALKQIGSAIPERRH